MEDDGKPKTKEIGFKTLSDALNMEVNRNKMNLESIAQWTFINQEFKEVEEARVRKFVKNSIYRTQIAFYVGD